MGCSHDNAVGQAVIAEKIKSGFGLKSRSELAVMTRFNGCNVKHGIIRLFETAEINDVREQEDMVTTIDDPGLVFLVTKKAWV